MKLRMQIQLEWEEHEALKREARRLGTSASSLARDAIRQSLGLAAADAANVRRFLAAAGCGTEPDEARDVAVQHDRYLYGDPP